MKTRLSPTPLVVVAGAIFCLPFGLAADTNEATTQTAATPAVIETGAQTSPTPAPAPATTATRETAAVKLPYGVDDVLKLSRAQISEDVTLNYIQNSGTIYGLTAKDIVYLKNEGVSDKVINAMQDQRKRATESAAPSTAAASPAVQVYSGTPAAAPVYVQEPIYVQEPLYFEPITVSEPEPAPASTLYVIPYPTPTYPRYTYASSYPQYAYAGSYGIYGGPAPFRPAAYGPAFRGGPGGVYHFGGGRGAGGTRALGGGHAAGGSRGHSGHHR
jgi:hypothetical protein